MKSLQNRKKKLALPSFFYVSEEIWFSNSRKPFYIDLFFFFFFKFITGILEQNSWDSGSIRLSPTYFVSFSKKCFSEKGWKSFRRCK